MKRSTFFMLMAFIGMVLLAIIAPKAHAVNQTNYTANGTYTVPAGVSLIYVEAWGGGGAGTGYFNSGSGQGGGGGAYSSSYIIVSQGQNYSVVVGSGGVGGNGGAGTSTSGTASNLTYNGTTYVLAAGGAAGSVSSGGTGGQASAGTGTIKYSGGNGGKGGAATVGGGGGGGGAGTASNGGNGGNGTAGVVGTAGTGGTLYGGNGGAGQPGGVDANGIAGSTIGGGGGGAGCDGACGAGMLGGNGSRGQITVTAYDNSSALVLFSVKDSSTNSVVNTSTNITLNGADLSVYSLSSSTGTFPLNDSIAVGIYTATISSNTYPSSKGVVTINSTGTIFNVTFYVDSGSQSKTFSSFDTLGQVVENGSVSFSRSIGGSVVVYSQVLTDSSGYFTVNLNPLVTYLITGVAPSAGYNNFTGTVTPNQDITYPIAWVVANNNTVPTSPLTDTYTNITANYYNTTKVINVTYEVISPVGDLDYFGLTTTYNGTTYTQNISGSVGGGIAYVNISNVNLTLQNVINVRFFYKRTGFDEYSTTSAFMFIDATPASTALPNLFTGNKVPTGSLGKGILATFILALLVAGTYRLTSSKEAATFVGLCVVAFFALPSIAWYPRTFGVITVVIGALGLAASEIARRF